MRRWSTVTATARCESRHCLLHRVGSPQTAAPVRTRNHAGASRGDACPRSRLATRVEAFGEPSARMPEVEASRSSATPRSRSRSRRSRLTASDSACTVSVNVRRLRRGMAMASGDFVSYLRVSTDRQGVGGPGDRGAARGRARLSEWRPAGKVVAGVCRGRSRAAMPIGRPWRRALQPLRAVPAAPAHRRERLAVDAIGKLSLAPARRRALTSDSRTCQASKGLRAVSCCSKWPPSPSSKRA